MLLLVVVVSQRYSVANFIQQTVIDWFAHILNGLFRIQRGHNLVLPGTDLVGRQNADLSPSHLFLVNHHCLRYMIHLGLHFGHLRGLKIHQLQKVISQRVDLVGNASQRLSGVVFRLLERCFLVIGTGKSKQ